jgi:hypothetical protein
MIIKLSMHIVKLVLSFARMTVNASPTVEDNPRGSPDLHMKIHCDRMLV